MKDNLLFFSSVDENPIHQRFVFPFITSALITHPGAKCEVAVPNALEFVKTYPREVTALLRVFGGTKNRVSIRGWDPALLHPKFKGQPCSGSLVRFLELPKTPIAEEGTHYTYLCDIDLLFVANILPYHTEIMEVTGRPYTNIIRPNTRRMTGCMMVESGVYYPAMAPVLKKYIADPEALYYPIRNDEEMLYRLVKESGLPLPDNRWGPSLRPMPVIHTSKNRKIDGDVREGKAFPGWGCTPAKLERAAVLFDTAEWREMAFPREYREEYLGLIEERVERYG